MYVCAKCGSQAFKTMTLGIPLMYDRVVCNDCGAEIGPDTMLGAFTALKKGLIVEREECGEE